jgi:hypothetical protein
VLFGLREAGGNGLLQSQITKDIFAGHIKAGELDRVLGALIDDGMIEKIEPKQTKGRPAVRIGITWKGLDEICERSERNRDNILQNIINTEDMYYTEYAKELLNPPITQYSPYDSIYCANAKEIPVPPGVDVVPRRADAPTPVKPEPVAAPAPDLDAMPGCMHQTVTWDDAAGVSVCADCGECIDDKMSLVKPACHVCGVTSGNCSHMRKQNRQV